MTNKYIIVLTDGTNYETWGALTDLCNNHKEFSYSTLKGKKFPFWYKGFRFYKSKFRNVNL